MASEKNNIQEFHNSLILAQWALGFFSDGGFEKLRVVLKDAREGVEPETGRTWFSYRIQELQGSLSAEKLHEYDANIVRHWQRITKIRNATQNRVIEMKYYQYLTLLMSELYFDWFFNRHEELHQKLSEVLSSYNNKRSKSQQLPDYTEEDLRKLAFWEATGSGKTLMMHVNLLQYLERAQEAGKQPDRLILITPNEGLTTQHLKEFAESDIRAEVMMETELLKATGIDTVFVVDAHKLISQSSERKKGDKSFYAECFEGNNLVLVDEGHHGISEDSKHRESREQISRDGFSIEYSATFAQVAKETNKKLRVQYSKCILFDYSYSYWNNDGYGKNAYILNLKDNSDADRNFAYLCANLLAYYQQHWIYDNYTNLMREYGIEKPLCVFVGHTVNQKTKAAEEERSDVQNVINFFRDVLKHPEKVCKIFKSCISEEDILQHGKSNPLKGRFEALRGVGSVEILYKDMLLRVFNTSVATDLSVTLNRRNGDITLAVNECEPFALINIGDSAGFVNSLEQSDVSIRVKRSDFGDDYFKDINEPKSTINVLVGARKFVEGWSSWRVSSMGLLNVGRNEGSQIIQLFGRGVRLKGKNFSLKRTTREDRKGNEKLLNLSYLETLHVFGIRADYMAQFREYLTEEGVATLDQVLTLDFPIVKNNLPSNLMVPVIKDGYRLNQKNGFKRNRKIEFKLIDDDRLKRLKVKYIDYAAVEKLQTETNIITQNNKPISEPLPESAFSFFDWDGIYQTMLAHKACRGYWNLTIKKNNIRAFANVSSWYELYARRDVVTFDSFGKLKKLEKIFCSMLQDYMDKFYKTNQNLYESEHREFRPLDDSWIPESYHFEFMTADERGLRWKINLETLKEIIEREKVPYQAINRWMDNCQNKNFILIATEQHLYMPLLYKNKEIKDDDFKVTPLTLDCKTEVDFVRDLQQFYTSEVGRPFFEGVSLYLMRNASNKLKGIGFAQAGNFYPDFMMWMIDKKTRQQYLTFIDPKGLRNHELQSDSKINFFKEIKELEKSLNADRADKIILNSVILSTTSHADPLLAVNTREFFESKNILFMEDGWNHYMPKLFSVIRPN